MNKKNYILTVVCFVCSLVWAANPMDTNMTINWYGQGSLLDNQQFSDSKLDNNDDIERKKRHRRRRKLRPPRKGG